MQYLAEEANESVDIKKKKKRKGKSIDIRSYSEKPTTSIHQIHR